MKQPPAPKFAMTVDIEDVTGEILSAYFNFRKGRFSYSEVFAEGAAIADYDKNDFILGVELIAPCKVTIFEEAAKDESLADRSRINNFVRKSGPREFVAT